MTCVEARSPPVSMTDRVIGSAEACPCAATAAKKVAASRRAAPMRIVGMFALLPVSRAFAQLSFICKNFSELPRRCQAMLQTKRPTLWGRKMLSGGFGQDPSLRECDDQQDRRDRRLRTRAPSVASRTPEQS